MSRKNIGKRSLGRQTALKALYSREVRGKLEGADLIELVRTEGLEEMPKFGRELVNGCLECMEELDEIIQKVATNWRLGRMPNIDRNILRIAVYELMHCPDTPPKVAINEAIELSKIFSTEDSPNFINGVLDKIYNEFVLPRETAGECEAREEAVPFSSKPEVYPDPDKLADLHMHSDASDGDLSPARVVEVANQNGLAAISLTDHDSVDGVERAVRAGEEMGITVVPGVEMSAYIYDPRGEKEFELHILGYFIDIRNDSLIRELQRLREIRVKRIRVIAEKLADCGVDIDVEKIIEERYSTVGRLQVALEIIEQGYCKDIEEVFNTYLGDGKPADIPKEKLSAAYTIELIHKAGGCAVLAHPGLAPGVEAVMGDLENAGLDGIEVHYTGHEAKDAAFWMDIARKKNMVISGGSDYHGNASGGVQPGLETVSLVEVHNLLERSKKYSTQAGESAETLKE